VLLVQARHELVEQFVRGGPARCAGPGAAGQDLDPGSVQQLAVSFLRTVALSEAGLGGSWYVRTGQSAASPSEAAMLSGPPRDPRSQEHKTNHADSPLRLNDAEMACSAAARSCHPRTSVSLPGSSSS
jgi:hypothetical protein